MKKTWFVLVPLAVLALGPSSLAQEHQFGLRVGNTNFDDPDTDPLLPVTEELRQRFLPPGCIAGSTTPTGCPGTQPTRGSLFSTDSLLNDSIHLDKLVDGKRTLLDFRRDFDAEEYEGQFVAGSYEWRRDTDAHFSLSVDAGVFSSDATHVFVGNAFLDDPLNVTEDPFDFDSDGNLAEEDIPVTFTDRLEYTLYFVHITPRYNFTTGKVRVFVGGGLGMWANLWREVIEAEFLNLSCDLTQDPNCSPKSQFRESDGDRRTVIPFSVSAGAVYQFLPHWSFNIEDRFTFSADSNVTLNKTQSDFDVGGNQVILGFSYRL